MYERYSENHARGMDYEVARSRISSFMHANGPVPRSYVTPGHASRNCSTSQQDMPSPIESAHHGDRFLLEKDSSVLGTEDPYLLPDGVRKSSDVHRKGKVASLYQLLFHPFLLTRCVFVVMSFFYVYSHRLTMVDLEEGVKPERIMDQKILRS